MSGEAANVEIKGAVEPRLVIESGGDAPEGDRGKADAGKRDLHASRLARRTALMGEQAKVGEADGSGLRTLYGKAPGVEALAKSKGLIDPSIVAAHEDPAAQAAIAAAQETQQTADIADTSTDNPDAGAAERSRAERVAEAVKKAKAGASRNRQLERERDTLRRQNEIHTQQLAQMRQQAERGQRLEHQLRSDPLAALNQSGVSTDQLVARVLAHGTPEEKIQALQSQLAADRAERERERQQLAAERRESQIASAAEICWGKATEKGADGKPVYPNLKGHPKDMLLKLVASTAREAKERYVRETGTAPVITDRQILKYLNEVYRPATPEPAKKAAQEQPAKRPNSLSNRHANGGLPASAAELSRAERLRRLKGA